MPRQAQRKNKIASFAFHVLLLRLKFDASFGNARLFSLERSSVASVHFCPSSSPSLVDVLHAGFPEFLEGIGRSVVVENYPPPSLSPSYCFVCVCMYDQVVHGP